MSEHNLSSLKIDGWMSGLKVVFERGVEKLQDPASQFTCTGELRKARVLICSTRDLILSDGADNN